MKTVMKLIVLIILICPVITYSSVAITVVLERVGEGGTRAWNRADPGLNCIQRSYDCKVTVHPNMVDNSSVWAEIAPMGGYIVHAQLTKLQVENTVTGETASIAMEGFAFQNNEVKLVIQASPEYPALIGTAVLLNGVIVGQGGWFSVYIPPVH